MYREIDYNRISAIVKDNYNLSVFAAALDRTGMGETLQEEEGPFTALVPSDDAFARAGLADVAALKARSAAWVNGIVDYHIVPGKYELHKFPYLINQEVRTRNKGKLYISRWIKGNNTILTINGARVILQDMPASNGHLQIIDRVLEPYAHASTGRRRYGGYAHPVCRSAAPQRLNGNPPKGGAVYGVRSLQCRHAESRLCHHSAGEKH